MYTSTRRPESVGGVAALWPTRPPPPRVLPGALRPLRIRAGDPFDRLGLAVAFERNQTIYSEGDDADYCYKVVSGMVRVCRVTENGRRQIAAFLVAGDLFGWTDAETRNFSSEAVTAVTAECFLRARIDATVLHDPKIGCEVIAQLSVQLACAHDHLLLLGCMTAVERVATFFLALGRRQGVPNSSAATVELAMNRRDIADYLGLTVETVSRTMSGMKRSGVIGFADPNSVRLMRNDRLARLANAL